MKAVILAAGLSSRLYPLTLKQPKCLLDVGGLSIIERQIENIQKIGINDIIVVVGYKKDIIKKNLGDKVKFRDYEDYDKTNNLHTLWSIESDIRGEFMCFFSDVLFDPGLILEAKESTQDFCMIIDTNQVLEGTMRVNINDGTITDIGGHLDTNNASGNFIGIAKFSKMGSKKLFNKIEKMHHGHKNDYYTIAINELAKEGEKISYIKTNDRIWIEIDTKQDYKKAKELFR